MPSWVNLPNALTSLRLALVPFLVSAILDGRHTFALALFVVAAVTDVADGAAARLLRQTSRAGAYLDPIADKCLLSGVFLALALAGLIPWWLVVIVFGRDIYILCGAALFLGFTSVRSFPPSVWGKASTFVQIVTVTAWMARDAFPAPFTDVVSAFTLGPCAAVTLWSGAHYTWRAVHWSRPGA